MDIKNYQIMRNDRLINNYLPSYKE